MKKSLFMILASLIILGCAKEPTLEVPGSDVFYAQIDNSETKVSMGDNNRLYWNVGDRISIFKTICWNLPYKYRGADGATSAIFAKDFDEDLFFSAEGLDVNAIYAVYPYHTYTKIQPDGLVTAIYDNLYSNMMIAVTESASDNQLLFKNLSTWVKLQIYSDTPFEIKSIAIKGNNEEPVYGTFNVRAVYEKDPEITKITTLTKRKVIDNINETISTDADHPSEYIISFLPTYFEKGFKIEIEDVNGNIYTKETTKTQDCKRNVILNMPAFKVGEDNPATYKVNGVEYPMPQLVDLGLPSGNLWANMDLCSYSPEVRGLYFANMETEPVSQSYDYGSAKRPYEILLDLGPYYCNSTNGKKYYSYSGIEQYDAATKILGSSTCMPNSYDYQELIDNCDYTYSDHIFTFIGKNGNKLIIPEYVSYNTSIPGMDCADYEIYPDGNFASRGRTYYMNEKLFIYFEGVSFATPIRAIKRQNIEAGAKNTYEINGVEYPMPQLVDLGLPSGTLWADRNLGATDDQHALVFQYGRITPIGDDYDDLYRKDDYANLTYGEPYSISKEDYDAHFRGSTMSGDYVEFKDVTSDYDASTQILGEHWRNATVKDLLELAQYTYFDEDWRMVSKINGNSINVLPMVMLSYCITYDNTDTHGPAVFIDTRDKDYKDGISIIFNLYNSRTGYLRPVYK